VFYSLAKKNLRIFRNSLLNIQGGCGGRDVSKTFILTTKSIERIAIPLGHLSVRYGHSEMVCNVCKDK